MLMGIDAGNYETKVCTGQQVYSFISDIGEYRDRRLKDTFSKDDMVVQYNNSKYFAGTLAKFESEYAGTIKGKSKAHHEAILRVLIAVFRYGGTNNNIIVGQPIESHSDSEKAIIKEMLKGKHALTINDMEKEFTISKVEIAPEGASAILSNPQQGLVRVIDVGSGTTNFATLYNLKRIDKDSFTEQIGTEIMLSKDFKQMAHYFYKVTSYKWSKHDDVYLTGGGAQKIYEHLKELMPNCKVLKPVLNNSLVNTKYANAISFYRIAERVFL